MLNKRCLAFSMQSEVQSPSQAGPEIVNSVMLASSTECPSMRALGHTMHHNNHTPHTHDHMLWHLFTGSVEKAETVYAGKHLISSKLLIS